MQQDALLDFLKHHFSDRDTTNFNHLDYVYAFGDAESALFYSALFLPSFEETDGMVLTGASVEDEEDRQRAWDLLKTNGHDKKKTEEAFNLMEISSIFSRFGAMDDDAVELLMERIALTWHACLRASYPGREFTVRVLTPEETGGDIGIVFHQS